MAKKNPIKVTSENFGDLLIQGLEEAVAGSLGALSAFVTWLVNRNLTFSPSSRGPVREGMRYGGVGVSTSGTSFGASP